jgi:hypothetical protein
MTVVIGTIFLRDTKDVDISQTQLYATPQCPRDRRGAFFGQSSLCVRTIHALRPPKPRRRARGMPRTSESYPSARFTGSSISPREANPVIATPKHIAAKTRT